MLLKKLLKSALATIGIAFMAFCNALGSPSPVFHDRAELNGQAAGSGTGGYIVVRGDMLSALYQAVLPAVTAASPMPSPEPTPYAPPCADSAWNAIQWVDVYVKRGDLPRALMTYASSANQRSACSAQFRENSLGHFAMESAAARDYSRAADLAFGLRRYVEARDFALKANALYQQVLRDHTSGDPLDGTPVAYIKAEMTANADLISRIPRRRR